MDLLVRRRALLAAAKVALSFSIAACGAAVEDPSSQDDTTNDYLSKRKDAGVAAKQEDCGSKAAPTTACGIAKPGITLGDASAAAPVSPAALQCCTNLVASHRTDAGDGWMDLPESAAKDPDVLGCCGPIIAHGYDFDFDAGAGIPPWQLMQSCCRATGNMDVACTPWGPPAPPAMTKLRRDEIVALMMADLLDEVA